MAPRFIQGHGELNRTMEKAILRTLAYADIFDYPLTKEEIGKWLIAEDRRQKTVDRLNSRQIRATRGFYHLLGRKEIVKIRKKREQFSASKMKLAEKVAGILRLIPWVKLIGVTGALAMRNSNREDDIDLLMITSKNRLWLTRLLAVFLVELMGKRRRPGDQKVKDKICLNMLLDESHLALPEKERDLFSAHEVLQMKILWERGRTYQRFLMANQWSGHFLANAAEWRMENGEWKMEKIINHQSRSDKLCLSSIINHFERLAQTLQLWYMRNRRTTEKISEGSIRFHPQDAREWVLREYKARLKKLRLG